MATTAFSRKMGQAHILGLGGMLEAYGPCPLPDGKTLFRAGTQLPQETTCPWTWSLS